MDPCAGACGLVQVIPAYLGQEQSPVRKMKYAALVCMWPGLVPFTRKLQALQAWKEIDFFYASLQPTPANEMCQEFKNPEPGKFWSGGKGPTILS